MRAEAYAAEERGGRRAVAAPAVEAFTEALRLREPQLRQVVQPVVPQQNLQHQQQHQHQHHAAQAQALPLEAVQNTVRAGEDLLICTEFCTPFSRGPVRL